MKGRRRIALTHSPSLPFCTRPRGTLSDEGRGKSRARASESRRMREERPPNNVTQAFHGEGSSSGSGWTLYLFACNGQA